MLWSTLTLNMKQPPATGTIKTQSRGLDGHADVCDGVVPKCISRWQNTTPAGSSNESCVWWEAAFGQEAGWRKH